MLVLAVVMLVSASITAAPPQRIEAELNLITPPVASFVSVAALDAFKPWAKAKYGVDVKTNYTSKGTQLAVGMIREWGALIPPRQMWFGGWRDCALRLACCDGFLIKHEASQELLDRIPTTMGTPQADAAERPPQGLLDRYCPGALRHCVQRGPGNKEIAYDPPPKTWEDLLNDPKFKGQIAQCTPDNSSSNHASYEVILQKYGWEKGWDWLAKLAAYTGQFVAKSGDVPGVVAKGEYALGFAVPSYMAFENYLHGADIRFIAPPGAYVTPEPIGVIKNCKNPPNTAKAFIEFLLTDEGQRLFIDRGLFPPIVPDMKWPGRLVPPPRRQSRSTVAGEATSRALWRTPMTTHSRPTGR